MPEPIRIGIIGAGQNTRERHIPGFQALEDVEIVAVCNRSRESGEFAAREFGIPHVHTDWRAGDRAGRFGRGMHRHLAVPPL